MEQNFIENELIILTKQTYDAFLKSDNPVLLLHCKMAKNESTKMHDRIYC